MTMIDEGRLQQLVEKQKRLATSRGFTMDYQNERASRVNVRCYKSSHPRHMKSMIEQSKTG